MSFDVDNEIQNSKFNSIQKKKSPIGVELVMYDARTRTDAEAGLVWVIRQASALGSSVPLS